MEFNKSFKLDKELRIMYKFVLTLSILLFILIIGYSGFLYKNYDISSGIIDSFHLKKISNFYLTPVISEVKKDDEDVYKIEFKKLTNDLKVKPNSSYLKGENGKIFYISKLDIFKVIKENINNNSVSVNNSFATVPIVFEVFKNAEIQREKTIKIMVPLNIDEDAIKVLTNEVIKEKNRITYINFDKKLSFLSISTDNKYVSKDSDSRFIFKNSDYINDLSGGAKEKEEVTIPFNIGISDVKLSSKNVKLSINTIPYIDKELMTPIIGANVKYLDEIHTLEFNPIKGVEIKFSDSFISNDGNGKYSFKSVDALEKYNKRLKSSINYTADFQFISRGKIIGKSKANIKLYAKTVCNLDSIESTTYNDVQTVSGYVPSMSNVYINGEQVGIDTSDINGYRFSKEIYLENGKNLIKVRVVRQGEIPYEKNLYISKETDEVTPEAPEITIPEVTYSDIVNVYIKTSPLYTIYINDEKFEVNSDGIVSIDYTLLDGFAKYKWKIVIYDENNNEVLNNEYYSTYTSNN